MQDESNIIRFITSIESLSIKRRKNSLVQCIIMSPGGALSTCPFLFPMKHSALFYIKGKRSGKKALNLLVLVVILSTRLCQLLVYIFQPFVYKNQLIFSCLFTNSAVCLQKSAGFMAET